MPKQMPVAVPMWSASRSFWFCHIGGVVLLFCLTLVFWLMFGISEGFAISMSANTVWLVGFFVGGLYLRQRNIRYRQLDLNGTSVVLKNIRQTLIVSVVTVAFMSALTFPFFLDEIVRIKQIDTPEMTRGKVIWTFLFGNLVQSTLYFVCWIALYLGITNSRRARRAQIDNLRLQNSLKEARLSSLANQLNPHFLFNALNNIRFMITEDAKQAETMLMSLSAVLRYSLESSKQETVMLSQELDITERYLDLVKIQFEDRLRLSMQVDDGLQSVMVPPMMLQMLLENAVKHGVERLQHGGEVSVRIVKESELMKITVINSMPESTPMVKSASMENSAGIGLRNIDQRLQLLYGAPAGLHTEIQGGQFHTHVIVPLEHTS